MQSLMVNPRRRRRSTRRRRTTYRRRRNPGVLEVVNPRRRSYRRRNPRGFSLRGGGGMPSLVMDGAMIAVGGMLGTLLPGKLWPGYATASPNTKALASIGTGVLLGTIGRKFLPGALGRNLALGAVANGAGQFMQKFTGGISGLSLGQELTETEIDKELRQLVSGMGVTEEFDVQSY